VLIRNVPTDIRGFGFGGDGPDSDGQGRMADGNSIFIFEVTGLCIGHLGHLHHLLAPEDLGWIGQLDVVMVPVDGTYTLAQTDMAKVLDLLKARLVLPMHYFTASNLERFLSVLSAEEYEVVLSPTPETTISVATLPDRPTVLVLPGN
jgi:L-ascorbate metabolism protein UlaG (beta-lactamase superfamily)